jgi:heme exporter protein D
MVLDANLRRRWFGAAALAIALAMLIVGETVLKNRLKDLGFLVYWFICFCATGLAVIVAFVDARALRQHAFDQRRDLLQTALKDIQKEARARARKDTEGKKP